MAEGRRPEPWRRGRARGDRLDARALQARVRSRRDQAGVPRLVEKLLLAVFHCVLVALLLGGDRPRIDGAAGLLGMVVLVGSFHYLFGRHLSTAEPAFMRSTRSQAGMYGIVLLVLGVARLLIDVGVETASWLPLLIPLSLVTVVARIVHGQRFSLDATIYAGSLLGLLLWVTEYPEGRALPLLAVLFAGAFAGGILTASIRKRSKLVKVGAAIALAQVAVLLCFHALSGRFDRLEVFFAALQGLGVGYLVSGSLPMIEVLFNALTDISLLELCNQNDQPLLKKLLIRAPGTHHHSFIVGVLAEAAAESVGANPLLCRAGAYYHDIGKMVKPEYFAENQTGPSLHDALEPAMSCLIICAHTKDGLEIGRRYGLHESILEFIPTHHGTSLVRYFYHKALKQSVHGDLAESAFRYPGPRPRTKETGLVNIADAVEAATRSLDDPSPTALRNKVHDIIHQRMMDRQLDETGLTFSDLARIEESFLRVLVGIYHARPKYPEVPVKV